MKKVLLGTLAVLTLAACSKDEVIQQNPNDEISFTATAGKAISRAQDGYCNKSLPDKFNVWANIKVAGSPVTYKPYFSGDEYTQDGSTPTTYKNTSINRYWPKEAVSFFACKNATPEWKSTIDPVDYSTLVVKNFTVANDVTKQVDFIYATVKEANKPTDATTAQPINFRHALSQIEFMAKNLNSKIYVEISSVKVMHVYNQGTFTFPTESTDHNYKGSGEDSDPIHSGPATKGDIENQGEWDVNTSSTYDYTASFDPVPVKYNANPSLTVNLTVKDDADKEWNKNTMYLMPYGDATASPAKYIPIWDGKKTPAASNKAYFQITAKIWNVAATTDATPGDFNETTDLLLYNGEIAVKMPDNTVWEQGKRYVYTFVFTTDGNGGSDPSTGDPVLTPITLDVTVDDFVDGDADKDVDMTDPTPGTGK